MHAYMYEYYYDYDAYMYRNTTHDIILLHVYIYISSKQKTSSNVYLYPQFSIINVIHMYKYYNSGGYVYYKLRRCTI